MQCWWPEELFQLYFGRYHLSTIAVQRVLLAGLILKISWRLLLAAYQVWVSRIRDAHHWGSLVTFVHFQEQCDECKAWYQDCRVQVLAPWGDGHGVLLGIHEHGACFPCVLTVLHSSELLAKTFNLRTFPSKGEPYQPSGHNAKFAGFSSWMC